MLSCSLPSASKSVHECIIAVPNEPTGILRLAIRNTGNVTVRTELLLLISILAISGHAL